MYFLLYIVSTVLDCINSPTFYRFFSCYHYCSKFGFIKLINAMVKLHRHEKSYMSFLFQVSVITLLYIIVVCCNVLFHSFWCIAKQYVTKLQLCCLVTMQSGCSWKVNNSNSCREWNVFLPTHQSSISICAVLELSLHSCIDFIVFLRLHMNTVNLEIFIAQTSLWLDKTMKIKHVKYFLHRIIGTLKI